MFLLLLGDHSEVPKNIKRLITHKRQEGPAKTSTSFNKASIQVKTTFRAIRKKVASHAVFYRGDRIFYSSFVGKSETIAPKTIAP